MSTTTGTTTTGRVGDWVQAHGLPGRPSRRGEIVEVLGAGTHEHYRVRWDEHHESIVYPADGVAVVRRGRPRSRADLT